MLIYNLIINIFKKAIAEVNGQTMFLLKTLIICQFTLDIKLNNI